MGTHVSKITKIQDLDVGYASESVGASSTFVRWAKSMKIRREWSKKYWSHGVPMVRISFNPFRIGVKIFQRFFSFFWFLFGPFCYRWYASCVHHHHHQICESWIVCVFVELLIVLISIIWICLLKYVWWNGMESNWFKLRELWKRIK